jgi:diadenosine tetraphosphate (Ap4A) HIT family hydrolase
MSSPFLAVPQSDWLCANELAFAIRDRFPVSPGHTLVIPRREVATWWEATRDEQAAIFDLVEVCKRALDARAPAPEGYNIGINAGEVAGQTVMHLHLHLIPRYRGDVPDPRGGIRHVIPQGQRRRSRRAAALDGRRRAALAADREGPPPRGGHRHRRALRNAQWRRSHRARAARPARPRRQLPHDHGPRAQLRGNRSSGTGDARA